MEAIFSVLSRNFQITHKVLETEYVDTLEPPPTAIFDICPRVTIFVNSEGTFVKVSSVADSRLPVKEDCVIRVYINQKLVLDEYLEKFEANKTGVFKITPGDCVRVDDLEVEYKTDTYYIIVLSLFSMNFHTVGDGKGNFIYDREKHIKSLIQNRNLSK